VSYICFAKNLSNLVPLTHWYRDSFSIFGSVSSTPKYYQRPRHGPIWQPRGNFFLSNYLVPWCKQGCGVKGGVAPGGVESITLLLDTGK
jgi:hypothetical protein